MPTVTLPYPTSANHLRIAVRGRIISSAEYRAWQNEAVFLIRQAMRPIEQYPVGISIILNTRNMRRDADNAVKPIVDALVKAGILADDNLAHLTNIQVRLSRMTIGEESVMVHIAKEI